LHTSNGGETGLRISPQVPSAANGFHATSEDFYAIPSAAIAPSILTATDNL
jgi:hypothetical protein